VRGRHKRNFSPDNHVAVGATLAKNSMIYHIWRLLRNIVFIDLGFGLVINEYHTILSNDQIMDLSITCEYRSTMILFMAASLRGTVEA